jgi:hypothetical protein
MKVKNGHAFDTKVAAAKTVASHSCSPPFRASSRAGGDTERPVFPQAVRSSPWPAPPSARTLHPLSSNLSARVRLSANSAPTGGLCALGPGWIHWLLGICREEHRSGKIQSQGSAAPKAPAANGRRPRLSLIPA